MTGCSFLSCNFLPGVLWSQGRVGTAQEAAQPQAGLSGEEPVHPPPRLLPAVCNPSECGSCYAAPTNSVH